MSESQHPLDALEVALEQEREALLKRDLPGVLAIAEVKLQALKDVETVAIHDSDAGRIARLSEMNRENSMILARRRREVGFLMRTLGIMDSGSTYQADGSYQVPTHMRYFGAG